MKKRRKRLVVSGVNLVEGGTLRVFQNFLAAASEILDDEWEIIALVNSKKKFTRTRAKLVEISWPKRSWIGRLYFEWKTSFDISKRLGADVWFAIHDITPRIAGGRKVVYCHNPMPFYEPSIRQGLYDPKAWLFSKFYGYLYGIGIKSNDLVVVQQEWIRRAFVKRYGVCSVLVAYPDGDQQATSGRVPSGSATFIFPSLARPFKNFEVIAEAATILEDAGIRGFEVILTIDRNENRYARDLIEKYDRLSTLKFIGRQSFVEMQALYERAHCLIFPSHIETWGLPITEAKAYGLDILAASEPYAFETVGAYDKVAFFATSDARELADKMLGIIEGRTVTGKSTSAQPGSPFVQGWGALANAICSSENV